MRLTTIIVLCFFLLSFNNLQNQTSTQLKDFETDKVLSKIYEKLNSIKQLQYKSLLELNYSSESYHKTLSTSNFIDFSSTDTIIGFKYQLDDENSFMIFNGSESFVLDKKQKTIEFNAKPKFSHFKSITFFHNSLVTLKKALPSIIADKSIEKNLTDTVMANRDFYSINLILDKTVIERLGGFSTLSTNRKITYKVIVDKNTLMPIEIIQSNNINGDFIKSIFSNIEINKKSPSELSWYYSSYTNKYKLITKKELDPIKQNSIASDWQLPLFDSNEFLKLSQLKGKIVLLEFWIKNCGYCISAVPQLNSLAKKYKDKNMEVLGINVFDEKEDVFNFYQKTQPNFKTVYNGGKVADKYGIGAFPTVVLLDKNSSVIYSGNFDQSKIEALLETVLQ